ncbi:hypothetical protein A6A06_06980 [Streptomyces sp. CB02923]|uniref:hypothetical protein n=1 Tax=Streptomyces sp. CB02923 TaxID=1718985 RepID=UPI000938BDC2|nr:hypothetical protein [Streptomyces sp. CB02923]OKI04525.1 hypothetical protein A6A06_06980 [Streptomyces sp. CB02923]
MHFHGYLWTGVKQRFDEEALRRPPHPYSPPAPAGDDDTAGQRLVERYREVRAEFPVVDLPPLETAYWLTKPGRLVRGTWGEPEEAARWLGKQLTAHAPRFASEPDRGTTRPAILVRSAAERLGWGGDVSHGFYLERPSFLSLTLVCCSPNRTRPELVCPER